MLLCLCFRDSDLRLEILRNNLSRPHKATANATERKGMIPIAIQTGFNDIFVSFSRLINRGCADFCDFKTEMKI